MDLGREDRLYRWLRSQLLDEGYDRLGDDAAVLPAGGPWTVTVDQQIEDVHFPAGLDPTWIARRSLAVNLSDLAAMGAEPRFAFLALSCPASFEARRFLSALIKTCRRYDVELAGGDLARSQRVATALTLVGRRPRRGRWVRRSSARMGDRLWIGGPLGMSFLGQQLLDRGASIVGRRIHLSARLGLSAVGRRLAQRAIRHHLAPDPQIELGKWLGRRQRAAAIDISDGLAIDLHRLCRESGVGAEIVASRLPTTQGFEGLCEALGLDPLEVLLSGGEDYVLLFALPPRLQPPAAFGCSVVGRLVGKRRLRLIQDDGIQALKPRGWDHFRDSG